MAKANDQTVPELLPASRDGDPVDLEIGTRLRQLRDARGMPAREVAARAGITASHLSRVENGRMSPTVSTLTRITQAIGEPVWKVFGQDITPGPVVRHRERQLIKNRGVLDYLLTPTRSGQLEVFETIIEPGAGSGQPAYSHTGDEECIVVLEGSITIWLGETRHELGTGDAITFPCRTPHRWTNSNDREARLIWIVTPAGGY